MRQNIQMRKVCYKVSEGLYNKAIKEGATLEDIEKDIKIIMDALGLSEEEKENESKTEELDINVDNNSDDFAIEDKTEEFVDNDENNASGRIFSSMYFTIYKGQSLWQKLKYWVN